MLTNKNETNKNRNLPNNIDKKITLLRDGVEYTTALSLLLKRPSKQIRLFSDDKIIFNSIIFKKENVLIVGETGDQKSVNINSISRPTLTEILFNPGVFSLNSSDFSQIYVLRKKLSHFNAYHIDITNPTRVNLASKFEMRPDDIIFVATQPLSLYSRALSQILGSTGLTLDARNAIRSEVGN